MTLSDTRVLPAWTLAPLLILGPVLTCGAPRIMAPLFITCGVLTILAKMFSTKKFPCPDKALLAILGGLVAYGAVSYAWSIAMHAEVLAKTGQLIGILGVSVFLLPILRDISDAQRQKLGWMVFAGLTLGTCVYFSEIFTHFAIFDGLRGGHTSRVIDNKQNKVAVILALWAMLSAGFVLMGDYKYKKLLTAGLGLLAIVLTVNSESDSGTLIAFAALPIALLIRILPPRAGLRLALFSIIDLFSAMPFVSLAVSHTPTIMNHRSLGTSILNRFEIWDMTSRRIAEHPLRGWGLEASRHIPGRGEYSRYYDHFVSLAQLHPHNGPLQVWFEWGAPGIMLGAIFFLLLGWRLETFSNPTAIRYGTFVTGIMFAVTLSIWGITQTWFMATLAIVAITAATFLPGRSQNL